MAKKAVSNIFKSAGPADTARLAAAFAGALTGGEVLLLDGAIGAGKTFFTRELARAFGARSLPVSASFNLMRSYRGRLRLYHFDLFRAGEADLANIGLEEYLGLPGSVTAVEWPGPAECLVRGFDTIKLAFALAGGDRRAVKAEASGAAAEAALAKVIQAWRKK